MKEMFQLTKCFEVIIEGWTIEFSRTSSQAVRTKCQELVLLIRLLIMFRISDWESVEVAPLTLGRLATSIFEFWRESGNWLPRHLQCVEFWQTVVQQVQTADWKPLPSVLIDSRRCPQLRSYLSITTRWNEAPASLVQKDQTLFSR